MRRPRDLVIILCSIGCGSCTPLNPSARDVIGRWQVECEGGKETLDLKSDGHYVFTIESPQRHVKVDGTWTIKPSGEWLESGQVVLRNAPPICEEDTLKKAMPGDSYLAAVREWGHTELSFNPDFGGFRRVR